MRKIVIFMTVIFFGVIANAADIIDEWDWVVPPVQPKLNNFVADNETALLILDIESLTCNLDRRPRCIDTVPNISKLLTLARMKNIFVVYSLTPRGTVNSILKEVSPTDKEPFVNASVNKFLNTDLDKILKDRGIKKLIITGTAAHGAVLFTATEAAQRGYQIVVVIDGISADLYAEQAVIYILLNGPGTRDKTIITRSGMIEFK